MGETGEETQEEESSSTESPWLGRHSCFILIFPLSITANKMNARFGFCISVFCVSVFFVFCVCFHITKIMPPALRAEWDLHSSFGAT